MFKDYIQSVVRELFAKLAENKIGKPSTTQGLEHGMNEFGHFCIREVSAENATGLYKQIEDANKKIKLLEEYLGVSYLKTETTERFEGYKKVETTPTAPFMSASGGGCPNWGNPEVEKPAKKSKKKSAPKKK